MVCVGLGVCVAVMVVLSCECVLTLLVVLCELAVGLESVVDRKGLVVMSCPKLLSA